MSDDTGTFQASTQGGYGVIQQISGSGIITVYYEHAPPPNTITEVQNDGTSWHPVSPSGFKFPVGPGSTALIRVTQSGVEATNCTLPRQGDGKSATYNFNWIGIQPPPPSVTVEAMESAVVED